MVDFLELSENFFFVSDNVTNINYSIEYGTVNFVWLYNITIVIEKIFILSN